MSAPPSSFPPGDVQALPGDGDGRAGASGSAPGPRRRWWDAASDPSLPAIGARRAYAETLLTFAAFFVVGVVAAVLLLAGREQDVTTSGSWGVYGLAALGDATQTGLAVAVVLLLGGRRGVGRRQLGLVVPRRPDGRLALSTTVRIVAWCAFGLVAGGVVNAALQTGHLPTRPAAAPELLFGLVDSAQAGIVEEMVVLAFVVVTLRQARRPWWEVTVVALALRGSYHIYYGPGVVGILLWAGIYYWTYLRFRQLLPLIVCHAAWDATAFLSQRWEAVGALGVLMVIGIWIAAPILWLVERSGRPLPAGSSPEGAQAWPPGGRVSPSPAGHPHAIGGPGRPSAEAHLPPPGWYPDPAGGDRWRWWDGQRWTDHLSNHDKG